MVMNYGMMNPYMSSDIMTSGMMNPYGYGMMFNPSTQINYMNQWDQFGIDRQVNLYKGQNNAQYQMSAQTDGIARQVQILSQKARNNEQNNIQAEYNRLVSAVKSTYGSQMSGLTADQQEAQAKAYAERIYMQQTGAMLTDDIERNANGSFVEGFKQVLTFGLGNRTTSQENISKITGAKLTTAETSKKYLGYAAGTATLALGAIGLYKYSRPIGNAIAAAAKFLFKRA